jgi:hypothetical protein
MFQFRLSAEIEISLSQFVEFTLILIQSQTDLTGDGSLILDEIQGF